MTLISKRREYRTSVVVAGDRNRERRGGLRYGRERNGGREGKGKKM